VALSECSSRDPGQSRSCRLSGSAWSWWRWRVRFLVGHLHHGPGPIRSIHRERRRHFAEGRSRRGPSGVPRAEPSVGERVALMTSARSPFGWRMSNSTRVTPNGSAALAARKTTPRTDAPPDGLASSVVGGVVDRQLLLAYERNAAVENNDRWCVRSKPPSGG